MLNLFEKEEKMPRKISEITDGVFVTARLSKQQRDMYYDLGGHDWLRRYIDRQIRSEEIQLGVREVKNDKR